MQKMPAAKISEASIVMTITTKIMKMMDNA